MITLRANDSLRIRLENSVSTQLPWYATARDVEIPNGIVGLPVVAAGLTNDTTEVTLISSPSVGNARLLSDVSVHNPGTEGVRVHVEIWNGVTAHQVGSWFLNAGDRLNRGDRVDWTLFDSLGVPKVIGGGVSLSSSAQLGELLISGEGGLISAGVTASSGSLGAVPWRRFAPSETGASLVLTPGGAGASTGGALTAQAPDGTVIGGNARGTNAVDWQRRRNVATQVASGQESTISGGYNNTASGQFPTVAGGQTNTASGERATVAGGGGNTASGQRSTVGGGLGSTASGTYATVAGGFVNTASGQRSTISGGFSNTASGQYTFPAGARALSDHSGEFSLSGQQISFTAGVLQQSFLSWGRSTTTAAATELSLNVNTAPSGTTLPSVTRLIMENNSAYAFLIRLVGRDGSNNFKWWEFRGCIKRGANAAATVFVGPITTLTGSDTGVAAGWEANLQADTTFGGLAPFVTGSATTIRWMASGHLTKVRTF